MIIFKSINYIFITKKTTLFVNFKVVLSWKLVSLKSF